MRNALICGLAAALAMACSDPASTPAGRQDAAVDAAGPGGTPDLGAGPGPRVDAATPPPVCPDRDSDGYQDVACNGNVARGGGDCDDGNDLIHPNREENCSNQVDNDCNGRTPDRDPFCGGNCADLDNDGFQDMACNTDRRGGGDCDDQDPRVNPGVGEICGNFRDDDCRGGDVRCLANCTDQDLDGFGEGSGCFGTDCNDRDTAINPWASEICGDNIDQDCSGADLPCPQDCQDNDHDGFGMGPGCINRDCDDADPTVNPGARELAGDGIDQDCSGRDLEVPMNCSDLDGDGYGQGQGCFNEDCDDGDPRINRDRTEICGNGVDDDCVGGDRPCVQMGTGQCVDPDGDGFGPGACANGTLDCDNNDPLVNPNAPEACDGRDNNCNGQIDECPRQGQLCEQGGQCVGGAGAPCANDQECAQSQGLACNREARQCRVGDGEPCERGGDCNPGGECITLDVCDPGAQRCYQAKGGPCEESCDCTDIYLCNDGGRCVECLNDGNCSFDDRDTCTDGGYCAETQILGGADTDVRYDFYRRLIACWSAWAESNEVQACDVMFFDETFMVEGAPAVRFGDLDVEYDNDSPCDDAALAAAGFDNGDIDVLDELFGGCSDLNLNRVNLWWPQPIQPGSTWCLYYAPEKSGFGFPQDTRSALVVDRCDLSTID